MGETKFTIREFKKHLNTLPKLGEPVEGEHGNVKIDETLYFIGVDSQYYMDEKEKSWIVVKGYTVLKGDYMVMTIDKLIIPWFPGEGEPVAVFKADFSDVYIEIRPYCATMEYEYDYVCKLPDNWHNISNHLKMSKKNYWMPGIKDGTIEFLS